ncbi:MAG: translation initiation factor IF-2, partial [Aerococcaceae bacterium]|nr:translation initiation factor IF-2 [Aerococcaceae bacterium]
MTASRVYEFAKEHNMSSKDLLALAKKNGIEFNSHMSSMTDEQTQKLTQLVSASKKPAQPKQYKEHKEQPAAKTVAPQAKKESAKAAPKSEQPRKEQVKPHTNQAAKSQERPQQSSAHKQATKPQERTAPQNNKPQDRPQHAAAHKQPAKPQKPQRPVVREEDEVGKVQAIKSKKRFGEDTQDGGSKRSGPGRRKDRRKNRNQPQVESKGITARKFKELPEKLVYSEGMNIQDISKLIYRDASEIIKKLLFLGVMVNQNQALSKEVIELIAMEYGIEPEEKVIIDNADLDRHFEEETDSEHLVTRPPVVTIMGHVDHGKTTLLDQLRNSQVVEGEAGGITQHIGAYQVRIHDNVITFLDTPGHEAFTTMRARGADVTDIAIIVVAADDGVMPQTVEAINHAKAADVPIIVAVNKIDKPAANPDRVMQELSEHALIPEAWGGDTIFVPISAKFNQNLEELLEMILLVAEVQELKANPDRLAIGTVIEARLDKSQGSTATLLVQQGTLNVGDPIVVGNTYGKVRTMLNDAG